MRIHVPAFIALLVVVGCSERSVDQRRGVPFFSGGGSSAHISSFSAMHTRYRTATYTSENTTLGAGLQPDTTADTVKFNGLALDARTISGHVSFAKVLSPTSSYINLGGGMNVFAVSGAWAAGFVDSLPGPSAKTSITSPSLGDTVHKSTGFSVSWSPTTSSASVAVTLVDAGTGARNCGGKTFVNDPGSMTFAPSDLSCLSTGRLELTVDRGYYRLDSLSPTKYMQLTLGSSEIIQLYLAP